MPVGGKEEASGIYSNMALLRKGPTSCGLGAAVYLSLFSAAKVRLFLVLHKESGSYLRWRLKNFAVVVRLSCGCFAAQQFATA